MRLRFFKYFIILGIYFSPIYLFSQDNSVTSNAEAEEKYLEYEGKVIERIYVNVIDISEGTLDSEEKYDTSWLYKAANTLHFRTREWVVRNWLLFSEGDIFEAKLITESERLLRKSGSFLDARISVTEASGDKVNLLVSAQDKWTLTLNLSYSSVNESYFGIKDNNLLGFGHSIDASVTHNMDQSIGTGMKGSYSVNNFAGTYINGGVFLQTNKKVNIQSLNISRPFLSNEIDWAGGLGISRESNKFLFMQNETLATLPYKIRNYDFWIGRSFPVWFGENSFRKKTRLIISGRINKLEHTLKPEESYGLQDLFSNSMFYLLKGGIINQRFYQDNYIEGFGHTEDVPVGGIVAVTAGTDKRGSVSRMYTGLKGVYSRRIENFGYASVLIELGAFKNADRMEQGVYNFNFIYHSSLIKFNKWKQRLFLQGDYLLGFNRFAGEQIYLNEDTGIRGMKDITIYGSKRVVLNLESRLFSPFSVLGFVLGTNSFIDLGLITEQGIPLTRSRLYQAYGVTLRVSNESFANAEFELGVVFNPYLPQKSSGSLSILLTSSFVIGIRNFEFLKPYIIGFKEN